MKHPVAVCGSRPRIPLLATLLMGAALLALPGVVPVADAQACCRVTALSGKSVSAVDTKTKTTFQFSLTKPVSLRVGDAVYANFPKKEVSCDGRSICGTITSITPGAATTTAGSLLEIHPGQIAVVPPLVSANQAPTGGSTRATTCGSCIAPDTCGGGGVANVCGCTPTTCAALQACGSVSNGCGGTLSCGSCTAPTISAITAVPEARAPSIPPKSTEGSSVASVGTRIPVPIAPVAEAQACCRVTAVSGKSVSAADTKAKTTFQFTVTKPVSLRVGDAVYANFPKKEVSCDGRSICGTITSIAPGVALTPVTPKIEGTPEGVARTTAATTGSSPPAERIAIAPPELATANPAPASAPLKEKAPENAPPTGGNAPATSGSSSGTSSGLSAPAPNAPASTALSKGVQAAAAGASTSVAALKIGSSAASTPPAPCVMPNQWPANTPDTYGKGSAVATATCFVATCGATATISGNTFPANSSDWLEFNVPASLAGCTTPIIQAAISSNPSYSVCFDAFTSATVMCSMTAQATRYCAASIPTS